MTNATSILIVMLALSLARAAAAQVWVDASQTDGKVPDWVEAKYLHPDDRTVPPSHPEPVIHRVWIEPVYQTIHERVWVDGHYETHTYITYDACGCATAHADRIWVPSHEECRDRLVCVTSGHYETIVLSGDANPRVR